MYWTKIGIEKNSDKITVIESFELIPEEGFEGGLDLLVLKWVFWQNIPILTLYSCTETPMVKQIEYFRGTIY